MGASRAYGEGGGVQPHALFPASSLWPDVGGWLTHLRCLVDVFPAFVVFSPLSLRWLRRLRWVAPRRARRGLATGCRGCASGSATVVVGVTGAAPVAVVGGLATQNAGKTSILCALARRVRVGGSRLDGRGAYPGDRIGCYVWRALPPRPPRTRLRHPRPFS